MSVKNVHVKLQIGSEYRRFLIQSDSKFSQFKERITEILALKEDFSIRYLDEETEWITISSDIELETGLSICDKIFRIQVVPLPNVPKVEEVKQELKSTDDAETECDKQGDECGKKWKRCRRGDVKEWKAHRKEWKANNKGEGKDGEGKKCGRWRREHGRKFENGDNDCGKKWRRHCNENKFDNGVDSDSGDEKLSLGDIKNEVSSLAEEIKLLKENKGKYCEELKEIKRKIVEGRQNPEFPKESIIALRNDAVAKKRDLKLLWIQIRTSKARIAKLRSIASTKSE